jgi:hypothetical protein
MDADPETRSTASKSLREQPSSPTALPIPTIAEVERITAIEDAVIRNLQITQCYHELSTVLATRTGLSANWCTFATWASKQAGQTIRKQDLARALEDAMISQAEAQAAAQDLADTARRLGARLGIEELLPLIWRALDPQAVFSHSSEAVARGNRKVFAEIGREFARFYADCLDDTTYDSEKITRFCEVLRPGDPPDGQQYLCQAFQHYYQALFETDPKARLELLFIANIEIGYHEQTRLQPEINEALDAPLISPQEFARNLFKVLLPGRAMLAYGLWLILHMFSRLVGFDNTVQVYTAAARHQAQFIVTETMMTIELPLHNRLRLGQDLTAAFPPLLEHINNPELLALLARIDPTPDSTRETGTQYWGDLADRLHFIADLFRCYEVSPELSQPPFTPEQTAAIQAGRLPEGPL